MKVLLLIIGLHFFADFNLQGLLKELKQKAWWGEQCRKTIWGSFDLQFAKYGKDYIAGLVAHGLYWTIVTFAPLIYLTESDWAIAAIVVPNAAFHTWVDHEKANRWTICFNTDQALHLLQIAVTFGLWKWLCAA